MATKSGGIALSTSLQQIAIAGAGVEVTLFGLTFVNTAAAQRTVTFRIYRADTASFIDTPLDVPARGRATWDRAIALQQGDYVSASADVAAVVNAIYSLDEDTGAAPVAVGFTSRGPYSTSLAYAVNDIVVYTNATYPADEGVYLSRIAGNVNNDPRTVTTAWMPLVTRGNVLKGSASDIWLKTDDSKFLTAKSFSDAFKFQTINSATGTVTPNLGLGFNIILNLTGNIVLNVPTGMADGDSGLIYMIQPAGGGCTLGLNAAIKKPGTAPTLPSSANAVARFGYVVRGSLFELTAMEIIA